MRICEICGAKEEINSSEPEESQSVILHVCENCRDDRKWAHYENWAF